MTAPTIRRRAVEVALFKHGVGLHRRVDGRLVAVLVDMERSTAVNV